MSKVWKITFYVSTILLSASMLLGAYFDTLGALVSHLAVGDGPAVFAPALISLVIVLISYTSFRKLGFGVRNP